MLGRHWWGSLLLVLSERTAWSCVPQVSITMLHTACVQICWYLLYNVHVQCSQITLIEHTAHVLLNLLTTLLKQSLISCILWYQYCFWYLSCHSVLTCWLTYHAIHRDVRYAYLEAKCSTIRCNYCTQHVHPVLYYNIVDIIVNFFIL